MALTVGYNPHWSNSPSYSSRMKQTIFAHQEVAVECTQPGAWKSDGGNSPFTFMNLVIKVTALLEVSHVRNSCFIEPGNSVRICLLWPTRKAVQLEILSIATPDYVLTKSPSMYQEETWTADMIRGTSVVCLGGRSGAPQFDGATYNSRQTESLHPLRWHLQKKLVF